MRDRAFLGAAQFKQVDWSFEKKIAHPEVGWDLPFTKAKDYKCFE
jgi:hypothetical protein